MTDLLKQQQLFNLLKDDDALFQEFLDHSKDSIVLLDQSGKIIEWNNATELLTGLLKQKVYQSEILPILTNILPRLNHSQKLKNIASDKIKYHIAQKGKLFNKTFNLRITNLKGEEKYITTLLTYYKTREKSGLGIISKDITKQLELNKKSRQNEKYLKIIFNNDAIGIAFYKPNDSFIDANQKFKDLTGYTFDELNILGIKGITHPDDQHEEEKLFQETYQNKGTKYSIEKRLIRKDKSIIWVKLHINFQWSFDNKLEMVIGFFEDVTQRRNAEEALKESERKYRFIAEKASDIIYSISLDSKITFYNRVIERVFDVTKEEIEQHKYDHLMLPKDKEFAKKLHENLLNGEKPPLFVQGFQTPKGKTVYLEISVNPLFDDNKNVIGSLGIARDVTDRLFAEQQLNEKNNELESLVKTRDKFLSIIAHDLRDPFNILLGFSELLMDNSLSEEKKKAYIESINLSANIGYDLLKNLLDWTRTQTGKLSYQPQLVHLNSMIEHVKHSLKHASLIKNINVKFNDEKQYTILCDENMLKTVLRNLISNAIKFSYPDKDIIIEISETDLSFIVTVQDFGVGIEEEDLNNLFKPGNVNIKKGTLNEKGTGLGLSICKEFVNTWGGNLTIKSTYGKGSTFSFSLPK